jgi:hypothetical protein
MSAHAILAILLARATATTRTGFLSKSRRTQADLVELSFLAYLMTAIAPTTSKVRIYASPILVIPPSRSFPPDEFWRGVSPIQAANSRPDAKTEGSDTVAATADAVMAPKPGIVSRRRLTALARCHFTISFYRTLMRTARSRSADKMGARTIRTSSGSSSRSRISSSSAGCTMSFWIIPMTL